MKRNDNRFNNAPLLQVCCHSFILLIEELAAHGFGSITVDVFSCVFLFSVYMVTIATKKRESERLTNGEIPFFVAEDSFDGVVEAGCLGLMSLLSAGLESCREALLSLTNKVCFLVAGSS